MKDMRMKSVDMKGMDMRKAMTPTGKTHKAVDVKAATVTVAHGPVPSLNWDAMTMTFEQGEDDLVTAVK